MTAPTRKAWLTVHVICSVGWLGSVATSLILGIAGLATESTDRAGAAYIALEWVGWWALVPLSMASLVTGTLQSLITSWGLIRHYWVLAKLAINIIAMAVLLLYMQTLDALANASATPLGISGAETRDPSPVLHGSAALVLLIAATWLSVFKPRGLTKRGYRYSNTALPLRRRAL
jgi:hypothetical protein